MVPRLQASLNLGVGSWTAKILSLMLKILYAGCLDLPSAISSQFTVEMCAAAIKCEKIHQNLFGVQGRSRSSKLTNLKSPWPVFVMISSMPVRICNRFHTTRANSGKITFFRKVPSLTPSFEGNPLTEGHEILSQKTRVFGAAPSTDFVISALTVLIYKSRVWRIDWQTDGETFLRH